MLRRRLSAGSLRAQAQAAIHSQAPATPRAGVSVTSTSAAAKATISPARGEQSKSLASAVLLGTQRRWKNETVVTLKAELKKRGLSQSGNKATLVSRLESAETTGLAPPVPPVSRILRAEAKARAQKARHYATPATNTSGPDSSTKPVVTTTPDLPVSAPAAEVPTIDPEQTAAEKTSAPGLPIKQPTLSDEFVIKFPDPRPDKERAQVIPTLPHIMSTKAKPAVPEAPDTDELGLPRVVTVAPASTHPDGGPIHGTAKVTDDALPVGSQSDAAKSALSSVKDGADDLTNQVIGKAQEQIAAAKAATDEILQLSGLASAAPAFKLPKMEGDGEYKASSRPLNSEEKSGAWVLIGVIGAVLLLGGIGVDKGIAKAQKKEKEAKEAGTL